MFCTMRISLQNCTEMPYFIYDIHANAAIQHHIQAILTKKLSVIRNIVNDKAGSRYMYYIVFNTLLHHFCVIEHLNIFVRYLYKHKCQTLSEHEGPSTIGLLEPSSNKVLFAD